MRFYLPFCFLVLLLTQFSRAEQLELPEILPADVRLVIDVSGSMKKNDPHNLRKPAMELLVKLLPNESRAGVWTFGQSVNLLVPHKIVNSAWRDDATGKAAGINSVAMFTNIGTALEQAAYDIGSNEKTFRNNIIILTDGMVDIETAAEVNAQERQRILTEVLPRLKQAGYIIHSIALSDEADIDLMEKLSKATDGVFATAKTAEQLLSTFLRIFDQAVPLERLPLENNRFLVDTGVEEFTALIFRKPNAQPTILISPDGKNYTAANALGNVKWHSTDSYDLITVVQPLAGEWQVNAELDPDNRVTVVSNLKLRMAPLKNNIEVSQVLPLHFNFDEDGEAVVDPQFLQLLEMDVVVIRNRDGKQWQLPLVDPVPPIDGVYYHPLELFRETGNYTVQLLIDGKTFKREFKHQVTVGSPFDVSMEKLLWENRVTYRVIVSADDQRVDASKTMVVAQIKDSHGGNALRNFELNENNQWQLLITPEAMARYSVGLQVSGLRTDGEPVKETLATQYFTYPAEDDPVPLADVELPADDVEIDSENNLPLDMFDTVEENSVSDDAQTPPPAPSSGNKKWLMYSSIGIAHLLIFGLAFLAYRMIVDKRAKEELDELQEVLEVDVQKIADGKRPAPAMQELTENGGAILDVSEEDSGAEIDIDLAGSSNNDFDDFLADLDSPLTSVNDVEDSNDPNSNDEDIDDEQK